MSCGNSSQARPSQKTPEFRNPSVSRDGLLDDMILLLNHTHRAELKDLEDFPSQTCPALSKQYGTAFVGGNDCGDPEHQREEQE